MILLLLVWCFSLAADNARETSFIKSFVTYYDCSQEGRYTHEYHPFLLAETRKSFQELEHFFIQEGFACPSRTVIMGYQEEGVPPFLPSLQKIFLQDEYVHQSEKGKTVPAHNVFGFLTGFLLKDAGWMQEQWLGNQEGIVYHHLSGRIALFNDYAYLFQKHAFGTDVAAIFKSRDAVERALKQQDSRALLKELSDFWQCAYKGELKNFSHQVLATQDILFSIDYAQHILHSSIPVAKLYTGPDITYPIEVLSCQEQKATESAQQFVEHFAQTLQPVDGKKTAYIFCSFVDGVGKSTLLGNVINWKNHGTAVEQYTRVDNSSSQRSTLYQLHNDVFILDLPAQLSHFVSKPDGFVFIPLDVAGHTNQALVMDHLQRHTNEYKDRFEKALLLSDDPVTLYEHYVALARLFADRDWIPFEYQDMTYLFKKDELTTLRVAVPLEGVQSRGLKIAHPAHMLFTKGLSLPMHKEAFMQDCAQKLKAVGVETLIFVDFLSMYPRSSRENVRVNFIIQELKKLYADQFDSEKSLYKTLTNGNLELLYDLQHQYVAYSFGLLAETVVRTALHEIFNQHATGDVRTLSSKQVTTLLQEEARQIVLRHKDLLLEVCQKKIGLERQALSYLVDDPTFQTVVNFSWKPLLAFSHFMERVWRDYAYDPLMSAVWAEHAQHGVVQASFSCASKDKDLMAKIVPLLRSAWYVSLINLLYAQPDAKGVLVCDYLKYPVIPYTLSLKNHKTIEVIGYPCQWSSEEPDRSFKQPFLELDLLSYKEQAWALVHDTFFMRPYERFDTVFGVFGLGCHCSPHNTLYGLVNNLSLTHTNQKIVTSSAVVQAVHSAKNKNKTTKDKKKMRLIAKDSPYRESIALMVRALATLEMIAKDQLTMIVTRRGNQEDFKAALLLIEKHLLVEVLHTQIEGPLFADYHTVEPVIPWDIITSYS